MKKLAKPILTASLILTIALLINFVGLDIANACGWGQGGGQSYVPQRRDSNGFLAQKQALLLPVTYFMATFTLPGPFRPLVRSHQKELYNLVICKITQTCRTVNQVHLLTLLFTTHLTFV